jgi:hypothetical protein
VVSCVPWKLYAPQKETPVLTGPQSQTQCFGEEKNTLSLAAIKSKFLSCQASSLVCMILRYSSHDDDLPVTLSNGSVSTADIIWSWRNGINVVHGGTEELGHAHGLLQSIAWCLPKLTYENRTPCPQWWFF